MLLVPGWRDLLGQPLHQVVAAQWNTTTRLLLDDLERLPSGSWTVAKYEAFVANPDAEIRRLCAANELAWDSILPQELPLSSYTVSTPDPTKWQRYAAEIDAVLPLIDAQARRAERVALRTLQT